MKVLTPAVPLDGDLVGVALVGTERPARGQAIR